VTCDVDVLVLGGGPAGAATALALARGGRSVAVVTRSGGSRPRIGETVPPTVIRPLVRLGLWRDFRRDGHVEVPGTVVRWGSDRPYENEAILNAYGCGWHLDRGRFDTMLIGAARAAGAQVRELPRGGSPEYDGRAWQVRLGGRDALRAPFLVDASGRAARTPARRGVRRHRVGRLIALVRYGQAARPDPRTVLESTAVGWWYAAVLPRGRAVIALFTDADLLPRTAVERERFWAAAASGTRLAPCLLSTAAASPTVAARAEPSCLAASSGPDWMAVGDAARTLDPLSGQGITIACESALRAAEVLSDPLRTASLRDYSAWTLAEYRAHLAAGLAYYGRERRWPDSPFWRRRHQQWSRARRH
jgi:flavin-dependent dehydrogenase